MRQVFLIGGLHLIYRRDSRVKKPEMIYLPHVWFFISSEDDIKERFSAGVTLFSNKAILDPDINKNRAKYTLDDWDSIKEIKGL